MSFLLAILYHLVVKVILPVIGYLILGFVAINIWESMKEELAERIAKKLRKPEDA